MAELALKTWHNHLPAWVARHPIMTSTSRSNRTSRVILQAIANGCRLDERGNLTGCLGGQRLADAAGVSKRSLERHLNRLIGLGVVVLMSRGGQLGSRNIVNVYGIPAQPGSLAGVRRRHQIMKRDGQLKDGRPRYVPEVLIPGAQATLYPDPALQRRARLRPPHLGEPVATTPSGPPAAQRPPQSGEASTRRPPPTSNKAGPICHYPHDTVTSPPRHSDAPTIPLDHPPGLKIPNGVNGGSRPPGGAGRRRAKQERGIRRIDDPRLLRDTAWLLQRHQEEAQRGTIGADEASRINFVAAAERALRITQRDGGDPCRLFAWLVNRGRWLLISEADEQAALARIRKHQRAKAWAQAPIPSAPARPQPKPSDDARFAKAVLAAASGNGFRGDPYRLARQMRPDLTRNQWERMLAEAQ